MEILRMDFPTKKILTLEAAQQIALAARAEAKKNGWTMVICIVDDGGHLIYLERMDGTQIGSLQVAQQKARTAALFKRPSKALEEAVTGGRTVMMKLGDSIPIEGGIPILVGTELIGAIGVSGANSPQDSQVAAAGLTVLNEK
jgi:glc operon protein GlcG